MKTQYIFSNTYTHKELLYFKKEGFELLKDGSLRKIDIEQDCLMPTDFCGISITKEINGRVFINDYVDEQIQSLKPYNFNLMKCVMALIDFKSHTIFFLNPIETMCSQINKILTVLFFDKHFYIEYKTAKKIATHLSFSLKNINTMYDLSGSIENAMRNNGVIAFHDFHNSPFLESNHFFFISKPVIIRRINEIYDVTSAFTNTRRLIMEKELPYEL